MRRALVPELTARYGVSRRRVCQYIALPRSTDYCRGHCDPQNALRVWLRLCDLAASPVRYGYRRLYVLLRGEGWMINHTRVYPLYRHEEMAAEKHLSQDQLGDRH